MKAGKIIFRFLVSLVLIALVFMAGELPSAGFADYTKGIKKVSDSIPDPGVFIVPDTHKTAFPMAYLYDNIWSTTDPSPYPLSLIENDSIIHIRLVNDSSDFSMPGTGRLTSPYGWRDGRFHHGFDVSINHGLPIYSAFSGVVRFAKYIYPYGRLVIVRHDNGLETYYAHLSRITVKSGQRISAGDEVGKCGNTGRSEGTHLHFEIRFKGISINPAHLISLKENRLIHNEIVLRRINERYFLYTNGAIIHKVRKGDYLHKIACEYGTTVKKIKECNDIPKSGYIKVGQLISIYP